MAKQKADETVTIRMPAGTADKLRAATGQPFSTLMRWTALALLEKHTGENRMAETRSAIVEAVREDPKL